MSDSEDEETFLLQPFLASVCTVAFLDVCMRAVINLREQKKEDACEFYKFPSTLIMVL